MALPAPSSPEASPPEPAGRGRTYRAYGLRLASRLALPELPRAGGRAEVEIRLLPPAPPPPMAAGVFRAVVGQTVRLAWPGVGSYTVSAARVEVHPAPGAHPALVRLFLLGPVAAVLLHLRGRLVLHGAAAAIEGHAVAILGGPGSGKSTLAASLLARGHSLLADDVTAVDPGTAPVRVPAGVPQLKLWPDSLEALALPSARLERLHPAVEKRTWPVGLPPARSSQSRRPLRAIYVIAESRHAAIIPLSRQEAFIELARHTYTARLVPELDPARHFSQCASLARQVPVARLTYPRRFDALPDVMGLIEAHCSSPPRASTA